MNSLGEHVAVSVPFAALDIGATNTAAAAGGTAAANHWVSLQKHGKLTAVLEIGTQTAGDSLLTITVQQATDSAGAGLKTLKAFTLADGAMDATGDRCVIEVDASKLDVANGFEFARVLVAQTDNTNVDSLTCVYLRSKSRYSEVASSNYTLRLPQDQDPD